ncbi:unnamed protein product, partial [Nezara viridula]
GVPIQVCQLPDPQPAHSWLYSPPHLLAEPGEVGRAVGWELGRAIRATAAGWIAGTSSRDYVISLRAERPSAVE